MRQLKKCLICSKILNIKTKGTNYGTKIRMYRYKGWITCSTKCSTIYNDVRRYLYNNNYKRMKEYEAYKKKK